MGSVINNELCPHCMNEFMYDEFNYKTGEFNQFCQDCGYVNELYMKRDKEGKIVKINPDEPLTLDNIEFDNYKVENPYAAFHTEMVNGATAIGTLKDEEEYNKYVSEILSMNDQINKAIVSRYSEEDEKVHVELIFQK